MNMSLCRYQVTRRQDDVWVRGQEKRPALVVAHLSSTPDQQANKLVRQSILFFLLDTLNALIAHASMGLFSVLSLLSTPNTCPAILSRLGVVLNELFEVEFGVVNVGDNC